MFSDCEGNAISFYKPVKERENKTKSTQTDNKKIGYTDREIQVIEKTDSYSQTNIKEIITGMNKNYDEKKLETFLKDVYNTYYTIY
jgi:hypothetical protein